jgi:hypothetical protein
MSRSQGELRRAVARKGSFVQTLKAVAWSFFGVRKSAAYERDLNELNPVHLVVAGVIAAVLFVVLLLVIVNWVLSSGVAG